MVKTRSWSFDRGIPAHDCLLRNRDKLSAQPQPASVRACRSRRAKLVDDLRCVCTRSKRWPGACRRLPPVNDGPAGSNRNHPIPGIPISLIRMSGIFAIIASTASVADPATLTVAPQYSSPCLSSSRVSASSSTTRDLQIIQTVSNIIRWQQISCTRMHSTARRVDLIDRRDGQRYRERCALALAFTIRADRSSVHLDQVTDDCQSQSHATMLPAGFLIGLSKTIENVRQKVSEIPWPVSLTTISRCELTRSERI